MFDTSTLPVSGSFLIACALYAGASLYAGQVVGKRTIAQSEWPKMCAAGIRAELKQRKQSRRELVRTDCESVLGRLHPAAREMCWGFGNPDLGGPMAQAGREAELQARRLEDQRLARAAKQAGDRCACASHVYRRENLVPLGVYAGTARTVQLPAIDNMQAELRQSLSTPACAPFDGTGQ